MKIRDIIQAIERFAPKVYQESYDNAGIQVGDSNVEAKAALLCLDCTEDVVDEAITKDCNLIIAHHPVIFGGLKRVIGASDQERAIIKAIKHDIVIYAAHTNLDNVKNGVNKVICDKLGLINQQILLPKKDSLFKLIVFVPSANLDDLREAMAEAGAGHIGNYDECSFSAAGVGSFKAGEEADPHVGEVGKLHLENEHRLEMIVPMDRVAKVVKAMHEAHPYEEVAHDLVALGNVSPEIGSGMVAQLPEPLDEMTFLQQLKSTFGAEGIRYTKPLGSKVSKVAVCGGSGSFLLGAAKAAKADVFITGDFKYHQFFEAEGEIMIADIGHYESEQFTSTLFADILKENFSSFAVHLTETNTNPINYL